MTDTLSIILFLLVFVVAVVLFVNRYARRGEATISTPLGKIVVGGENAEPASTGDVGGDVINGTVTGGGTVAIGKNIKQGAPD